MRAGLYAHRVALRDHLLSETSEENAAAQNRMAVILDELEVDRRTYEWIVASPQERSLADRWDKVWGDYRKCSDTSPAVFFGLGRQFAAEARALLYARMANATALLDRLLEREIDRNERESATGTNAAADGYSLYFVIILGAVLVVTLVGVLAGLSMLGYVSA